MRLLNELIEKIDFLSFQGNTQVQISNIQYDSRKCTADSLFIAIEGTQSDGHNYIEKAIQAGAVAVIAEHTNGINYDQTQIAMILVENSRLALAQISHCWYGFPTKSMKVIGITGTNGKTTTTFIIKSLFEAAGHKTAIIGTTGIYIGKTKIPATHTTPESLELCEHFAQMRDENVEIVAMEVSSHALAQYRADGIEFDAANFTNLTLDHLDYHKTMQDYAQAKKRLFDMLTPQGIAIVADNSEYSTFMLDECKAVNKFFIGRELSSDIVISNEKVGINGIEYNLTFTNQNASNLSNSIALKSPLLGKFNIDNTSFAASLAVLMGLPKEKVQQYMPLAQGSPGRMQRVNLKNSAVALVDYAHTPDALEKALLACKHIINSAELSSSKLICVFGCGGDRDKSKRPIMGEISSRLADFSIITDDNPRTENSEDILQQINSGVALENKQNAKSIPNRAKAIEYACQIAQANDLILVAGKGHEDYQIIGTTKHHFDDVEELNKYA